MNSIAKRIIGNGRIAAQREAIDAFGFISFMSVSTVFFKAGILIILFEHWFEAYYQDLALTPYSTRAYIGVHLWPSQIWFIVIGSLIAVGDLFKNNFRIPARVLNNAAPMFIVLAVYTVWSIYGYMAGNKDAIALFREMVLAGFSFPALVYLARHVEVRDLFHSFIKWSLIVSTIIAFNTAIYRFAPFLPGAQNGLLLISSFAYSYFIYKAIKSNFYIIPAVIVILPILIYFNKPMLAMIVFLLFAIALVSTVITKKINTYSISKRSVKISAIIFMIMLLLVTGTWYLNILLDGRIELAFRQNFMKERITESGDFYMGDISGGRMIIWGNAYKLWKEKPIFGNGMGTSVAKRDETIAQIHNYYLQALMDTGLVGLTILIFCWYFWYRRVFQTIRQYPWNKEKTVYASLLTVVIAYFFYATYGLPMVYLGAAHFFWVVIALLTVMPQHDSSTNLSK